MLGTEIMNWRKNMKQKSKEYKLYVDQYGDTVYARTLKELQEKAGGGKIDKMCVDKTDGSTVHTGYVVGKRWFEHYKKIEVPA